MICMKKFVCVVLAAFGLAACSVKQTETVPTPSKQLHPWVVYGEESSFAELEPVKDMIASVSVLAIPRVSISINVMRLALKCIVP